MINVVFFIYGLGFNNYGIVKKFKKNLMIMVDYRLSCKYVEL